MVHIKHFSYDQMLSKKLNYQGTKLFSLEAKIFPPTEAKFVPETGQKLPLCKGEDIVNFFIHISKFLASVVFIICQLHEIFTLHGTFKILLELLKGSTINKVNYDVDHKVNK
jgi:hypothetical protein